MAYIKIPRRFLKRTAGKGTVALRGEGGYFEGRRIVSGPGDRTQPMRVTQDIDVNKDGRIDFHGGTIRGRSTAVRGTNRTKGYVKTLR